MNQMTTYQKDELEEILGINQRTLRYYKEIGFLKGIKIKKKGKYTFAQKDIDVLNLVRNLRYAGLSLSEIKIIDGIYKISGTNNKMKLLKLYEVLKELSQIIEFKKRELEQLRKHFLDFKKSLQNIKELSAQSPET